jgi:hypothetical protein
VVETGGLENRCAVFDARFQAVGFKRIGIRKCGPRSGNCSKTVVAGEVAEWLMAPVLKTGIPERVSGVRIPPSPPFSLDCRESALYSSRKRRKSPQLRRFCSQTGLEKVPHFTQQASFVALFSEGHIGSPVSTTPPGECSCGTTTNQRCGR